MKIREFKRWLEARGVRFEEGARHWKLYLDGRQSTLPCHPAQELKEGTCLAILRQLGLK